VVLHCTSTPNLAVAAVAADSWGLWGLGAKVCFSGSVLLETFDIEVVSYDGNLVQNGPKLATTLLLWTSPWVEVPR